jgi:O-antigen ligase
MHLHRRLEFLPKLETGYQTHQQALLLATGLISCLTFLTPILSIITDIPALIFVAIFGAGYCVIILLLRQLLVGALVGLIVASPFAANVPLASHTYLATLPGHLGPQLWLVQAPLLLSVILVILPNLRNILDGATRTEGLFAVFVGWTVLAAIFGATARLDTALYFSLLMAQAFISFVLLRYVVQQQILSFRTVLQVFVGTILAQCIVAVAQFFHGSSFGITTLGEGDSIPLSTLSFGPLGTFSTGTYVQGFSGMSFILASLIILTAPIIISISVDRKDISRISLMGVVLVMTAVLRATASDAARGGLAVSIMLLIMGILYMATIRDKSSAVGSRVNTSSIRNLKQSKSVLVSTLTAILILFYPSSTSGAESVTTNVNAEPTTSSSQSAAGQSTGRGVEKILETLSIPYFDLTSLGVRFQQYFGGLDLMFQHPLFGIGGANFIYYSTMYGLSEPYPVHNIYIALLAETGIPGFVSYVIVVCSVLWYSWKLGLGASDNNLLYIGIFCGIVGYLSFGFWDHLQLTRITSLIPFWILAGAIVGEYVKTHRSAQSVA